MDDHSTLRLMARVKQFAFKRGMELDLVRFAQDKDYARTSLKQLLDTGDEDILLTGLQLMRAMDLVAPPPSKAADPVSAPSAAEPAEAPKNQYIGRLR